MKSNSGYFMYLKSLKLLTLQLIKNDSFFFKLFNETGITCKLSNA